MEIPAFGSKETTRWREEESPMVWVNNENIPVRVGQLELRAAHMEHGKL